MSNFTRTSIGISFFAVLLLMQGLAALAVPDDPAYVIRLSGIPGPYSFNHFCKVHSGGLWVVAGSGGVQYSSTDGAIRKMHVTDVDLNGVFFANANDGWVVGERGVIVHTEDGGLNWKTQTSGVAESLQAITCTNERRCWAVGEKAIILNTRDGGNHWKKLKSGLSARLFAVNFISNRMGWAVGEDGLIVRTTDGGKSWKKQRASIILFPDGPFATPTNLVTVRFIDKDRGWVAGAGGIARTVDGGKTWQVTLVEDNAFIGLVSKDGRTLWAVSREGTNYITRDGGLSWALVNSEKVSAKRKSAAWLN